MKRNYIANLLVAIFIIIFGMICQAEDVNDATEQADWAGDISLTEDGEATFLNQYLGYSWGTSDYYYNNLNGYPELVKNQDNMTFSFAILKVEEEMVDSLSVFAVNAIKDYYEDIPEGCVLAHVNAAMPGFEKMVGISTGVCYPTGSPTVFSSVYALTDTNNSIVVALTVKGTTEKIVEEWKRNYEGGECQYTLDEYFSDILDNFWFGDVSKLGSVQI